MRSPLCVPVKVSCVGNRVTFTGLLVESVIHVLEGSIETLRNREDRFRGEFANSNHRPDQVSMEYGHHCISIVGVKRPIVLANYCFVRI